MGKWKATTKSGTVYQYENGFVRIIPKDGPEYTIKPWVMRASNWLVKIELPWIAPNAWDDVHRPIVGSHLYVASRDEWRISTTIVSVEDL
jgi:hypothetical protein